MGRAVAATAFKRENLLAEQEPKAAEATEIVETLRLARAARSVIAYMRQSYLCAGR